MSTEERNMQLMQTLDDAWNEENLFYDLVMFMRQIGLSS
jgi:hypothetical protein